MASLTRAWPAFGRLMGFLLIALSCFLLPPILVDVSDQRAEWEGLLTSFFIILLAGVLLFVATKSEQIQPLESRSTIWAMCFAWSGLSVCASLPFLLCLPELSFLEALFEATSGLTTTGATVLTGLDRMSGGLLLWRAELQWLGGLGIIVLATSVLPTLALGGMQLFRLEFFDNFEKTTPRLSKMAFWLLNLYIGLTFLCGLSYYLAGMSLFDALCHAMTTISTGGFSTHDASLGYFESASVEGLAIVFMMLSAAPFLYYVRLFQPGRPPRKRLRDDQLTCFLVFWGGACLLTAFWVFPRFETASSWQTLRDILFSVTTTLTGTGYTTVDYSAWGSPIWTLFLILMLCGGCAGSTSCGFKQFRIFVLFQNLSYVVFASLQPQRVFVHRFNDRNLSPQVVRAVTGYFTLFVVSLVVVTLALAFCGLPFIDAVSAAAASLANVGPALGPTLGPSGTYGALNAQAQAIFVGAMLVGRLEIVAFLILFSRRFWRM